MIYPRRYRVLKIVDTKTRIGTEFFENRHQEEDNLETVLGGFLL